VKTQQGGETRPEYQKKKKKGPDSFPGKKNKSPPAEGTINFPEKAETHPERPCRGTAKNPRGGGGFQTGGGSGITKKNHPQSRKNQ